MQMEGQHEGGRALHPKSPVRRTQIMMGESWELKMCMLRVCWGRGSFTGRTLENCRGHPTARGVGVGHRY